ncbi:hypothetical protein JQ633_13330 [Bradyrhizobium tropiciagri]|uniref:hypothetical protein n=1 Tax=Bradyrhizobium tropiciagri TaxID=312253 RepID=UPI001BA951F9|nr:hypothetical protein [Bradyrhizobium tropiciagri]MBR0871344.1 hypothetical protein [Bradyrhizobium tropiciagri]
MRSSCIPAGLVPLLRGVLFLVLVCILACSTGSGQALAACELRSRGGTSTRVVQIQLDNLHLRRDTPNVPSDLEQMPHLREFLTHDGIIGSNHQISPLAQTATDALTILTGLYGDRMGVPLGSSATFRSDGSVGFASAFAYWTAINADGRPLMLTDTDRTVPAPWVPFTVAGCDVGAYAMTGLTLQDSVDVASTLGASDARVAAGDPLKARADWFGIAIHCARGSALCSNAHARSDLLPDEPGGYAGYSALFGNRHIQPVISPGGPLKDLGGEIIRDETGRPGFPGATATTASQSLGYAAAMLEAGVPVVYVGIGNAHVPSAAAARRRAFGPGERDHVARLAADDAAFKSFIDRLAASGITTRNTLFIVVSTGADRFVGGPPNPAACDGRTVPCSYGQAGAIGLAIDRLLAAERRNVTTFDVQPGNAPPFYIHGNPSPTDPLTRILAQDIGKLTALNPVTGKTDRLTSMLADRAQMQLMHLVTASPARTPHVIMFGDPDYLNRTAASRADCAAPPACIAVDPEVAWMRGDIPQILAGSWFGIAGPGIRRRGETADIVSNHADLRPTLLALLGLSDRYVHDGVVLVDALEPGALPGAIAVDPDTYAALARATRTLNDPLGQLARNSLALATQAVRGSDAGYERYLATIGAITARRDALAREMYAQLNGAAFAQRPINPAYAHALIGRAGALVSEVENLAGSSLTPADRRWKAASDAR